MKISALPVATTPLTGAEIVPLDQNGVTCRTTTGAMGRVQLSANSTYFVRTDGNNANSGLVNNSAGAWATIQFALDTVLTTLDFRGHDVTIQVGNGTWTEKVQVSKIHNGGDLIIQGDLVTPGNVIWNATSGDCLLVNRDGAEVDVQGFDFRTTTSGNCLRVVGSAQLAVRGNTTFGACAGAHVYCQYGAKFQTNSNYTINGGAQQHFLAEGCGSIISQAKTITISGTPAFSDAFANTRSGGAIVSNGNTYSGSATGSRFNTSMGGSIQTFGSGNLYFPGNAAGTANGGMYDGFAASFSANKNGSDQSAITTATDIKLTFTTELFDNGGYYDAPNSQWTPPSGTYRLTAVARWTANVVDQSAYNIQIRKNGSTVAIAFFQASGTGNASSVISTLQQAGGTDFFEVFVNGAGAGDKTISGSIISTYFCGENISM